MSTPAGNGFDPGPWLHSGIELVDQTDPGWLEDRYFHYDVVVVDSDDQTLLLDAVRRTQPQAPQIPLAHLDDSRLLSAFATVGVAPPAAAQ
jgi:hypothetical protein